MLDVAQFEVMTLNEWMIIMYWAMENDVSLPMLESLVEGDRNGDDRLLYLLKNELTKAVGAEEAKPDTNVRVVLSEIARDLDEEMANRKLDLQVKSDALTVDEARTLLGPIIGADYKNTDEIDTVFETVDRIIARVPDEDHKVELKLAVETLSMLRSAIAIQKKPSK